MIFRFKSYINRFQTEKYLIICKSVICLILTILYNKMNYYTFLNN